MRKALQILLGKVEKRVEMNLAKNSSVSGVSSSKTSANPCRTD